MTMSDPHDPIPLHPREDVTSTLTAAMKTAHDDVDNHYAIVAQTFRNLADDFRAKATYLEGLADKVLERSERVKSEIIAASDYEEIARNAGKGLHTLIRQMDAVINQQRQAADNTER